MENLSHSNSVVVRSPFGLFDLLPSDRSLAARFATTASSANPHWSFVDLLTRGYAVVEARPDELLVLSAASRQHSNRRATLLMSRCFASPKAARSSKRSQLHQSEPCPATDCSFSISDG